MSGEHAVRARSHGPGDPPRPRGHGRGGAGRGRAHGPRLVPHPVLHARGHPGRGASPQLRRPRTARGRGRAGQHLPPHAATGRRARGRPRRAPPLHRLVWAPAHRLRRLPGLLPRTEGHRRRRHLQLHLRRQSPSPHSRGERGDPATPRGRHPDGARRVPAAPVAARGHPRRGGADRRVGGRAADAHRPARSEGRPRPSSGSCRAVWTRARGRERRAHVGDRLRRVRHRRSVGRGDPRRDVAGTRRGHGRPPGGPAPLSHGGGRPRLAGRRRWPSGSTCSTACCPAGWPVTARS